MIACVNIIAGYSGRTVLHGVSFAATAGEFIAILGPNGGGKTTFLRALTGLVPLQAGRVSLGGSALESLSPKERAQRVAVLPQRMDSLPRIRVRDMALLGRYAYLGWFGAYAPADYAAAEDALKTAGALELADRFVDTLSGGEVQRALLARALAQGAPVLLLDELAAGLDPARMIAIFDVLEARRRAGSCVITVMHDVNLAALYATRLLGMRDGRICFDGPTAHVFTEAHLRELYGISMHVFSHPTALVPQACPAQSAHSVLPIVVDKHSAVCGTGCHTDFR